MSTGLDTIAPIAMAVGYLIYHGLQKAREADQKAEKMLLKKREEDFKADFVEKACASKEQEKEWSKTPRRDKERESVEVLRTILRWEDVKEWDYLYPYGGKSDGRKRTKAQAREEERESRYMETISEVIYYANRGKVRGKDVMSISIDIDCGRNTVNELMVWWEDKIRSFGIDHGIWAVYDTWEKNENGTYTQKTYKCRANEADSAYVREYYWDCSPYLEAVTEYRPISSARKTTTMLPVHHYSDTMLNSEFRMRIATVQELRMLCESGAVDIETWYGIERIQSIVADPSSQKVFSLSERLTRETGHTYSLSEYDYPDSRWRFLPAFDLVTNDAAELQSYRVGETYIIGSLYMEGAPVKISRANKMVPMDLRGNIYWDSIQNVTLSMPMPAAKYDVASVLELCEPLDDPDYQIFGVYIGNGVFLSRENVLRDMTYSDIVYALEKAKERPR